jgi:hypothetical protein
MAGFPDIGPFQDIVEVGWGGFDILRFDFVMFDPLALDSGTTRGAVKLRPVPPGGFVRPQFAPDSGLLFGVRFGYHSASGLIPGGVGISGSYLTGIAIDLRVLRRLYGDFFGRDEVGGLVQPLVEFDVIGYNDDNFATGGDPLTATTTVGRYAGGTLIQDPVFSLFDMIGARLVSETVEVDTLTTGINVGGALDDMQFPTSSLRGGIMFTARVNLRTNAIEIVRPE